MQSSIKKSKGLKRTLELIIPSQTVEKFFAKSYQKIQARVKMPGFRQGKIPIKNLKPIYEEEAYKEAAEDLCRSFYPRALRENSLNPAGPASVVSLDLREGQPGKLLLELEVHPQVKAERYKNLELKKQDIKVDEKAVAGALEKLRQSCAEFQDSPEKGPVKKGDFISVDVEGFLPSNSQKKLDCKKLLLRAGEDTIAPGFDSRLMGLSQNEEREFDFLFPSQSFQPESANLNLRVRVKLNGLKNKKVPELNNEFAKRFKLEALDELKAKIKKDLQKNLEQKAKEELENNVVKQLVEKNPVDLPLSLVEAQKRNLKERAAKRLEEYKTPAPEREAFFRENDSAFEKEARESLSGAYLTNSLIKDLRIKAADEEIKKSLQESFPGKKPEDMERQLKAEKYWDNFVFNLKRQKLISYLIEHARWTS